MSILASSVLNCFLIWLSKSWISERLKASIKHEYDQKYETFKASIQAQHNLELEKLRSELRIAAFEKEIRFAKLHERRAEVVAELHAQLQDILMMMQLNIYSEGAEQDIENIRQVRNANFSYFRHNKIYLPDNIELKIDKLYKEIILLTNSKNNESTTTKIMMLHNDLQPIFRELKLEFKILLGES